MAQEEQMVLEKLLCGREGEADVLAGGGAGSSQGKTRTPATAQELGWAGAAGHFARRPDPLLYPLPQDNVFFAHSNRGGGHSEEVTAECAQGGGVTRAPIGARG